MSMHKFFSLFLFSLEAQQGGGAALCARKTLYLFFGQGKKVAVSYCEYVVKNEEEKKEMVQVATSRILELIMIFNANGMMMTRMRFFLPPFIKRFLLVQSKLQLMLVLQKWYQFASQLLPLLFATLRSSSYFALGKCSPNLPSNAQPQDCDDIITLSALGKAFPPVPSTLAVVNMAILDQDSRSLHALTVLGAKIRGAYQRVLT